MLFERLSHRKIIIGAILLLTLLLLLFIGHSGWRTWQVQQSAQQVLLGSRIHTLAVQVSTSRAMERALTMARLGDRRAVDQDLQRELLQVRLAGDQFRQKLIEAVQEWFRRHPRDFVLEVQLAEESKHNRALIRLRERVDQPSDSKSQQPGSMEAFDEITHAIEHTGQLHETVNMLAVVQTDVDPNLRVISEWAANASERAGQGRGLLIYFIGARQPIPLQVRHQLQVLQHEVEHYLVLLRQVAPWLEQAVELRQAIQDLDQAFPHELMQMRRTILAAAASGDYPVDRTTWLAVANRAVAGLTRVATISSNRIETAATGQQQAAQGAMLWLLVLGILAMGLAGLAFYRVRATALSLEGQRNRAKRAVGELSAEIATRRELELDLRRYQTMVSTSPDHIALIDPDYTYRIVNSAYLREYDRSPGLILGKRGSDLFGEDVFERQIRHRLDRCLAGEMVTYEAWFDLPGRGRRYMNVNYFPFHDEIGAVVGIVASGRDVTELKITEETLRQREEQLRTITDAMPGLVMQLGSDYRYRFINQTGAAWFGLPVASLIGRHKREVIGEAEFAKIQPYYEQALAGTRTTFEQELRRADGVKRWLQLSLVPEVDPDGQVQSLYVLGSDITSRKQIESALEASQASFSSIVEQNFTGIVVLDAEGGSLFCNPAACGMLSGLPKTGVCRYKKLYTLPQGSAELAIQRFDGTWGVARALVSETKWQGAPARLVMLYDITERKRAKEAMRESRESLHGLLNSMFEGAYGVDRDGNCTFVNLSFLQMLGYQDESEVLGKHIHDLIHHSHPDGTPYPASDCRMYLAYHSSNSINVSDEVFWRKDGVAVPVEYWSHPIMTDGEVTGAIATFIDITERKQAEAALLELNESLEQRVVERTTDLEHARREADAANRAKSAFLATMSHEIRTPMNGVVGMVGVLEQSDLTVHQSDLVSTIRDSATALLGIIDDILDFSKIEAGRMELEHEPICLEELIEGLCDSLVPVAAHKYVDLNLFVSPDVPVWVLSDDVRLRQLFYNLVGNAIKFSAGRPDMRGQVSIRVEVAQAEPLRLTCRITDNGIGMSPETLHGLFTPFTQAEVSTTRQFGGTGLGLAICKRLVDLMAGEIAVESSLDAGSVFSFTLPMDIAPEQPARRQPDIAGLDCLLVESPDLNAADLRAYLEHAGARVHPITDLTTVAEVAVQVATPAVLILSVTEASAYSTELKQRSDIRRLLITRGRRRRARVEGEETVTLDGDAMRRLTLLRAVAVAAGRASPEIIHERTEESRIGDDAVPPTITEARSRDQLILVAEDDEINQKVILQQLTLLGYAAEMAGNGAEALRMWREGRYALLLTDLHMPEMDGYTLAKTIRQEEGGGSHMPIMALTANALRGEANRAYEVGMDEYLTKPVQLPELRVVLGKWLNRTPEETAPERCHEASTSNQASPLDVTVLQELIGDDPETVREFLADYLTSARKLAVEMGGALAASETKHIRAIVHKLKSSSRSVGALLLGDACAELENACGSGNKSAIAPGVQTVEAILAEVDVEIKRVLEGRE